MGLYEDSYFDLAVIDPPYGIKQGGSKNKSRGKLAVSKDYISFNDDLPCDKSIFEEIFRISKNQIIFGANHFISKIPYDSSCWLVWDKDNGNTDFADCELAWTSFKTAVRRFKFRWQGMLQEDMKNKEIRIHPTQKPVALYDWIYKKYCKAGYKIIDTHLGSGSSAIAAIKNDLNFVGIEQKLEYYNGAVNRIRDYVPH